MHKLSVIVITKNEEENIGQCLEGIKWADEIIVVDDNSTDKTMDICRQYANVKGYTRVMSDGFGPQKNYALNRASGDWILSIDADEKVSDELKKEILNKISDNKHAGYYLRRVNYVLGAWIPDYKPKNLRLFKKANGKFSDVKVHESVAINGKVGEINTPLIHNSRNYVDISSAIKTIDRYSDLMAENKFKNDAIMKGIQIPIRLLCMPLFYFFKKFLIHRGFVLGMRGFILAALSS